jgi:hypothetical protein
MLSDTDIRRNIIEIGKSRKRARYYRKIKDINGNLVTVQTEPLPADPESIFLYTAKGFTLKEGASGVPCPLCDFVGKNAQELSLHLKQHKDEGNTKEE